MWERSILVLERVSILLAGDTGAKHIEWRESAKKWGQEGWGVQVAVGKIDFILSKMGSPWRFLRKGMTWPFKSSSFPAADWRLMKAGRSVGRLMWINFTDIMLNKRSQTQNSTCCDIYWFLYIVNMQCSIHSFVCGLPVTQAAERGWWVN